MVGASCTVFSPMPCCALFPWRMANEINIFFHQPLSKSGTAPVPAMLYTGSAMKHELKPIPFHFLFLHREKERKREGMRKGEKQRWTKREREREKEDIVGSFLEAKYIDRNLRVGCPLSRCIQMMNYEYRSYERRG